MLIDIICQGSEGLPWSKLVHLNPKQIHSLLFPVERKAKLLLQSNASFNLHFTNIFLDLCFKDKAFKKYLGWYILSVSLLIPCLPAAVSYPGAIKKFKTNTIICTIKTPWVFVIFMWLFSFILLLLSPLRLYFFNYLFLLITVYTQFFKPTEFL